MWRSRCSSKYDAETPSIQRSKPLITSNITQLIGLQFQKITVGNRWENVCCLYEAVFLETSSIMLTWIKPSLLFVKLHSDGSCINGYCGGGGVIRTSAGNLVMAYSIPMDRGTSNIAEAGALLFGLKWYLALSGALIMAST